MTNIIISMKAHCTYFLNECLNFFSSSALSCWIVSLCFRSISRISKMWPLFFGFTDIHGLFMDWLNPLDITLVFRSWFTLLTAACQSPDKCQRYDLPLLYWDCLTRPSHLIHPLENPNALIPRGNIYFFFYNLLSNDLLIAASNLTENYGSFLGNQIFTHFMPVYVAQVSREDARGNRLWGAALCESLRCHSSTATVMSGGQPYDSLLLSLWCWIIYCLINAMSVLDFDFVFIPVQTLLHAEALLNIVKNKNNPCPHRRSQISVLKALMLQNVSSKDRSSKKKRKKKHARIHAPIRGICVLWTCWALWFTSFKELLLIHCFDSPQPSLTCRLVTGERFSFSRAEMDNCWSY